MSGSPIRILLVDDIQLFREIEKTFLHRSGYEILTAATGLEALEKAREYQPKLILLDCLMPVMDGIECCRRIKSDPALMGIKVIMITTRGEEEDRRKCQEAGCDGYLTKPVKRQEFLSCIEAALDVPARRAARLSISIKVSYSGEATPERSGVSLNLSASGLFVVSEEPPDVGALLSLSFVLPGVDERFDLEGEVVWSTSTLPPGAVSPSGFGLSFTAIDVDAVRRIEEFVAERLA